MNTVFLILTGIGFAGFIFGLAGKSLSVKKRSLQKSLFYQRITVISLVLMLLFAVLYQITD